MAQPEKLNLWDRVFNRTRREIVEEGKETWHARFPANHWYEGQIIPNSNYTRSFIKYKIIDRVTGSETIEKVYLN